jgi:hypothetical protein
MGSGPRRHNGAVVPSSPSSPSGFASSVNVPSPVTNDAPHRRLDGLPHPPGLSAAECLDQPLEAVLEGRMGELEDGRRLDPVQPDEINVVRRFSATANATSREAKSPRAMARV